MASYNIRFRATPLSREAREFYFEVKKDQTDFPQQLEKAGIEDIKDDYTYQVEDADAKSSDFVRLIPFRPSSTQDAQNWIDIYQSIFSQDVDPRDLLKGIAAYANWKGKPKLTTEEYLEGIELISNVYLHEGDMRSFAKRAVEEGLFGNVLFDFISLSDFASAAQNLGWVEKEIQARDLSGGRDDKDSIEPGTYLFSPEYSGSTFKAHEILDGLDDETAYGMSFEEVFESYGSPSEIADFFGIRDTHSLRFYDINGLTKKLKDSDYKEFFYEGKPVVYCFEA
jgi:hypothetical protein